MARTISLFFLHLCKIHNDGRSNKLVDFFFKIHNDGRSNKLHNFFIMIMTLHVFIQV